MENEKRGIRIENWIIFNEADDEESDGGMISINFAFRIMSVEGGLNRNTPDEFDDKLIKATAYISAKYRAFYENNANERYQHLIDEIHEEMEEAAGGLL